MESEEIFDECLSQTVYRDKQLSPDGVHLTLKSISTPSSPGQIDFGGGEYETAENREIAPEKRCEEDDYGWWNLHAGEYIVRFNEEISSKGPTFCVVSNQRLIGCGCSLASVFLHQGPIATILRVPQVGVSIKENARIALLRNL